MRTLLVLICVLCLFASPALAQKKGDPDKLYKEGVELLKDGNVEGAAERFRAALAIKRSAPLLFNLGQALMKLGKLSEAKSMLEEARAEADKNGPKAMVELASNALVALQSRFPVLTVELPSGVKDARIEIDGKPASGAKDATIVEPGRHELVIVAAGYERYSETFEVRAGEKKRISPKLEPDLGVTGGGKIPREPDPVEAEPTEKKPFPIGPVVLGVVGLAAIGGATYMFLEVKSIDEDRKELYRKSGCPGPSCPNGEPDDAATLRESAESKARVGNILLGVGAAAVAGSVVWFVLSSGKKKEPATTIGVAPVPGGALVGGRF